MFTSYSAPSTSEIQRPSQVTLVEGCSNSVPDGEAAHARTDSHDDTSTVRYGYYAIL